MYLSGLKYILWEKCTWVNVHLFADIGNATYVGRGRNPSTIKMQVKLYC